MSETRPGKRGPKTAEGKQRVSLNALKHGLHAKSAQARQVIEDETELTYEKALDIVRTSHKPADQMEEMLAGRMAVCMVRLSRLEAMERRMFQRYSVRSSPGSDFEALLRAERMVSQELHRCIRSLAAKRAAEPKARQQEPGLPGDHSLALSRPPTLDRQPSTDNRQLTKQESCETVSFHEETERETVPPVARDTS